MADPKAPNTSNNVEAEQSDTDDEPEVKRQKVIEPKKLTNIYYDCLEHILEFLDIESLLSLADTCRRMQLGAAQYFSDEFRNRLIILDTYDGLAPGLLVDSRFIVCTRLKFCLALLRCFGNKMAYLFVKTNEHTDHLVEYIIQYCGDALVDITFHQSLPVFPIENCQQPFKNVEKMSVARDILNGQLTSIVHCFPILKFLTMEDISFDANFVGVCLPQMKYLTMKIDDEAADELTERGLIELLRANPQLGSLSIDLGKKMALSTLLEIISGNSLITDLVMVPNPESIRGVADVTTENTAEITRLANEHPLLVNLYLPEYRFAADDAIAFMGKLTALSSFLFNVQNHSEFESFTNQLDKKWKVNLKAVISNVHFVELNL